MFTTLIESTPHRKPGGGFGLVSIFLLRGHSRGRVRDGFRPGFESRRKRGVPGAEDSLGEAVC